MIWRGSSKELDSASRIGSRKPYHFSPEHESQVINSATENSTYSRIHFAVEILSVTEDSHYVIEISRYCRSTIQSLETEHTI